MKKVKIQVGNIPDIDLEIRYITFLGERIPVTIVNGWKEDEEFYPATLRDISIIMYNMMGQGVTWQLAHELSKRIGGSSKIISEALFDIFSEFNDLSDEEDWKKHEEYPKLYDPMVNS